MCSGGADNAENVLVRDAYCEININKTCGLYMYMVTWSSEVDHKLAIHVFHIVI